jgi:hypothetical protein
VFCAAAPGVPEMPCTALLLAGVALAFGTELAPSVPRALSAGLLLSLACGHRYEAWFASTGVVAAAALLWRRSPRALCALVGGVAVMPLAWLLINHARSGDALDFVHRVVRYRVAFETLPPMATRLARYPRLLLEHAGVLTLLALCGPLLVGRRVLGVLAAAGGVLGWLVLTEVRGGGATHHVARSLLPAVWLLAAVAAPTLGALWQRAGRARPLVALLALVAVVQPARGLREVPLDIAPDTLAAGRALAAHTRQGTRFLVETARSDFLWLELASAAPERAQPDRPYGGPPPSPAQLLERARACSVAAVHSAEAQAVLVRAGWRPLATHGAWSLLAPPDEALQR